MYQGLNLSRRGLALVLILFCLPLFVGLRSLDLETDEAIYSFGVERILVDGQWMQPKSSPSDTAVFLEKPPLKFWIVAGPIKLGLLPNDEFGLRFWDAVMGAIAFAYVFAIGSRLAGPVCGGVAVLLLFVHTPLIFDHGLRTNNMEGALFLAYCGGVFHFLEWGGARETKRGRHAILAGLYFVLGFMTKFVAIAFLPVVAGLGALLVPATRRRLWADRGRWLGVGALALALILPWFVYAWLVFGSEVLHIMLMEHVVARFGPGLVAEHAHPFGWYVETMWLMLTWSHVEWLVAAGLVVLMAQSIRRWWFEGLVVSLWAVLPLVAISFGTSKLYHYAYPFLPPLMLGAGYLSALVMMLAPVVLRRVLEGIEDQIARLWPGARALAARPSVQRWALVVTIAAATLATWALLAGQARLQIGHTMLFKSNGVVRPIAMIVIVALLARRSARIAVLIVALAVAWVMPVDAYKAALRQLTLQKHPLRDVTDCIARVEREVSPGVSRGLFVDSDSSMWHPITFYFRRISPWTRQERPSVPGLAATLSGPSVKPSLVQELRYRDYLNGPERALLGQGQTPPMIGLYEYALLLPGPFRACSPEAGLPPLD